GGSAAWPSAASTPPRCRPAREPHRPRPLGFRSHRPGRTRRKEPAMSRPPSAPRRPRTVPSVEPLEDRCLPATFLVNSTLDTTPATVGTLRWAVEQANADPDPDTITFSVRGAIELNSALPDLSGRLTITGPGADRLMVRRPPYAPDFRIFTVAAGATIDLSGL